jgi:hypothetical protein
MNKQGIPERKPGSLNLYKREEKEERCLNSQI